MLSILSLLAALACLVLPTAAQTAFTGSYTSFPIPYGTGACQNARGMAVDGSGNMYIACGRIQSSTGADNGIIAVMDSNGNFQRNITQPSWDPFGIAFSGSSMYVTSLYTSTIYQLTTATGALVNSWTQYLYWPWGLTVDRNGNIVVANYGQGNLVRFSSSGAWQMNYSTSNPGMIFPEEVAVDSNNNYWVVDTDNNRIVQFNSGNGNVMNTWGNGTTNPSLVEPGGIVIDSQNSVYVCDTWNYAVMKLNTNGQQVLTLASANTNGTAKVSAAAGLAIDSQNQVYVLDSLTNNRVLKFPAQLNNGAFSSAASSAPLLALLAAVLALLAW